MSASPGEPPYPRCGETVSTTVGGADAVDQLAAGRVSCPTCSTDLVRAVDGHADRGWQLADADAS